MEEKIILNEIKKYLAFLQFEKKLSINTVNSYWLDLKEYGSFISSNKGIKNFNSIKQNHISDYIKIRSKYNINKRLNEKKNNDSKSNKLNTSVKISEVFPIKEEDLLKKIKSDLYLRESIKLFVEMLSFKES